MIEASSPGHTCDERRRRAVEDAAQHGVDRAGKRLLIREQLVEDRADGEDVAPVIDLRTRDLLGRHVIERAEHHARLRHARVGQARDAEVEDLERAFGGDDQVGRLDVAMDDAGVVRVGEAGAQLVDVLQLGRERQIAAPRESSRASVSPRTYSMAMYGWPSCSPTS